MDLNLETTEVVYQDGDSFFNDLGEALTNAKDSIYLETYIFLQDELGLKILNLLAEAVARGVRVQLLLDGMGSSSWNYDHAVEWRRKGLEIRFFHPLPWQKSDAKIWNYLNLRKWRVRFSLFSQRNHSKVCVIDEGLAFVGSMNINICHSSKSSEPAWRDTAVKLSGNEFEKEILQHINKFKIEWSNYKKRIGLYRRAKLNYGSKQSLYLTLLDKAAKAEKIIWLTTPYFSPNFALIKMLCNRAASGTDVRLLFPKKSDVWVVKYAMEGFYDFLLDAGVKVYEYTPAILHAKVSIIDDWVTVGSSNLDYQSLFYNLEADITLKKPENIKQVQEQYLLDLNHSEQVIAEQWSKRSLVNRALEKFFKIFIKLF